MVTYMCLAKVGTPYNHQWIHMYVPNININNSLLHLKRRENIQIDWKIYGIYWKNMKEAALLVKVKTVISSRQVYFLIIANCKLIRVIHYRVI